MSLINKSPVKEQSSLAKPKIEPPQIINSVLNNSTIFGFGKTTTGNILNNMLLSKRINNQSKDRNVPLRAFNRRSA
jgi:hypothetical protein